MMIQEFYDMNKKLYKEIEQELEAFQFGKCEWLSLHLRYLIYYMTKYEIQNRECFTAYHYRVSYCLYFLNSFNNAIA